MKDFTEARLRFNNIRQGARVGGYTSLSGITPKQLAAEMATNTCAICKGQPETLVVDHHHGNGRFRGMLCHTCNGALGLFRDSPEIIEAALNYLKKPLVFVRP